MHLEQITLENFGIYRRRTMRFDGAEMILLYGPNESGKTTTLNGLRHALFGFPQRNNYLTPGRTMTAHVVSRLSNGQELIFARRKGRKDELQGTLNGRSLEAQAITQLLGRLDLSSYEQLFGFSLDELRSGEKSLKSAPLAEALAGGAMGGINRLQQLRTELNESLAELYKVRGQRSLINVKLADLQNTKQQLAAVQTLPADIEFLNRDLQELTENQQQLRQQHSTIASSRAQSQRLLEILPNFRQMQAIQEQLNKLELPSNIDAQFVSHWSSHSDRREQLTAQLLLFQQQLVDDYLQLESLDGASSLLQFESEIEQLGHQADEVAALRKQAVELSPLRDQSQENCQRLRQMLQFTDSTDAIGGFVLTPPQQAELEAICQEFAQLQSQLIAKQAELQSVARTLNALQPTTDQDMIPKNLDELTYFVQQLQAAENELDRLASDLAALIKQPEMLRVEQQLSHEAGVALSTDWSLPTVDSVQQFLASHLILTQHIDQLGQDLLAINDQIFEAENGLAMIDHSAVQTVISQLDLNHQQRDLCLQKWESDLLEPDGESNITLFQQNEILTQLRRLAEENDHLQQRLIDSAQAVAEYRAGRQQIQQMLMRRDELSQDLVVQHDKLQQWKDQWLTVWQAHGITACSPEQMLAWLSQYQRWLEHQVRIDSVRQQLHIIQGNCRQTRLTLIDLWPQMLRADIPCPILESRINSWQQRQRDTWQDLQRIRQAEHDLRQCENELEQMNRRKAHLEQQSQQCVARVPVQNPWPVEQLPQWIDAIEQLCREDQNYRRWTEQLIGVTERLHKFDSAARELAERLNESYPAEMPWEAIVGGWFAKLQQSRSQRAERIRLEASIKHRQLRVEELTKEHTEIDRRLATLCSLIGSTSTDQIESIIQSFCTVDRLRQEMAAYQATIEGQAAGQTIDEIASQLKETNEIDLTLAVDDFSRQLEQIECQRKDNDQRIGSLTQRIGQIARNEQAGQLAMSLHHQRGQLADLCEQWVIRRLAAQLLDRAVQSFSSANEPILLAHTRQFFCQLTDGRYRDVQHDSTDSLRFTVRNANGESVEPDKLSTGTREQLYLAIRMAYVTHYCEGHEPLPVIMDDCFVNFDDQRTNQALKAIANWPIQAQRILLSCHLRVLHSLAEIAPDTPCIHLERDELTTVGELAGQLVRPSWPDGATTIQP